jgi:hypothetical protein
MNKYPTLTRILGASPLVVPSDKKLTVDMKREIIKDLYGTIGERVFGFDADRVAWMHQALDSIASDKDIEREWKSIQNGNVEKFLKMIGQLKGAGPEADLDIEQLQNIWEQVAEGIIKTKEAHQEIDDKTWDMVEKHVMDFVDEVSEKLNKKALPDARKKLN